jgi:hypothetical protein
MAPYTSHPQAERQGPRFVLRAAGDELVKANGHASFDLFDVEVAGTQDPEVVFLIESQGLEMMIDVELTDIGPPEVHLAGLFSYLAKSDKLFPNGGAIDRKPQWKSESG